MIALACDGPYNGQYIDAATALSAGYMEGRWTTGEIVWVQEEILSEQGVDKG